MKLVVRSACVLLVLLSGCRRQANADQERFDALLNASKIDKIQFISPPPQKTNTLSGPEAQRYLRLLNKTNRIDAADDAKSAVEADVLLLIGTNNACWLSLFDNGIWKFSDYSFRVRISP